MTGRVVIVAMLLVAAAAGAGLYYAQVYAYYREVSAEDAGGVQVTDAETGELRALKVDGFKAIDSDSSPIRFRACFMTDVAPADLAGIATYPQAEPLVAPGWFDCFDARALGAMLEAGEAEAWLGRADIVYGIDRVVALAPDGRGWMWHQINACGAVVMDGDPAPDGCPPPPDGRETQ